jgi:hypothetical protein
MVGFFQQGLNLWLFMAQGLKPTSIFWLNGPTEVGPCYEA